MANLDVIDSIEEVETAADILIENILELENNQIIDEQMTDECIYHLRKLASILNLKVDLDFFNDEYLSERNG